MRTIVKKYSHLIKPFDIIIVLVLLALSFLPNAIFAINKQREKKKQKSTRFSQLTEKKSSALNSVKIHHMKSSSTSRMTINIILLKSMVRVSVTRRIIVQTKSQCKQVGFPSQVRQVFACHMGWWLRLSQQSPQLVIMTPLSHYKIMWSSLCT